MRWMNSDELPLFQAARAASNPAPDAEFRGSRAPDPEGNRAISVSELNRQVKGVLEARFELRWVKGELSNVVRAASGHWYFVLKDENAQVRCVMFRSRATTVSFQPENGLEVEVRALPSLYEARGEFQLGVETMRRAGMGALFEAFERLKKKLAAEGLFDADTKRALPMFPKAVGIVTSLKAAALKDVLTTFHRRAPMIRLVIYPTAVQGADAPVDIAAAIDMAARRNEVDALLVCRGGGSMEDLWAFNDERVARAIHRLRESTTMPVVSGVGHETDFTITDFVADMRAPTPTAGAELLAPDTREWQARVEGMRQHLTRMVRTQLTRLQQQIDYAARGLVSPQARLLQARERTLSHQSRLRRALGWSLAAARSRTNQSAMALHRAAPDVPQMRQALQAQADALTRAQVNAIDTRRLKLQQQHMALSLLNPGNVLTRGYAMVSRGTGIDTTGRPGLVTSARTLKPQEAITLTWHDGTATATIDTVAASPDEA